MHRVGAALGWYFITSRWLLLKLALFAWLACSILVVSLPLGVSQTIETLRVVWLISDPSGPLSTGLVMVSLASLGITLSLTPTLLHLGLLGGLPGLWQREGAVWDKTVGTLGWIIGVEILSLLMDPALGVVIDWTADLNPCGALNAGIERNILFPPKPCL